MFAKIYMGTLLLYMELPYTGDNAPPRTQRLPNKKINTRCRIDISPQIIDKECPGDSQNNTEYCHCSLLSTRT